MNTMRGIINSERRTVRIMKEVGNSNRQNRTNNLLLTLVTAAALSVCTVASVQAAGKGKRNNVTEPITYSIDDETCIVTFSTNKDISNIVINYMGPDPVRYEGTPTIPGEKLVDAITVHVKAGRNGGNGKNQKGGIGDPVIGVIEDTETCLHPPRPLNACGVEGDQLQVVETYFNQDLAGATYDSCTFPGFNFINFAWTDGGLMSSRSDGTIAFESFIQAQNADLAACLQFMGCQ